MSISGSGGVKHQPEERRGTVAKRKIREMLGKEEADPEVEDVGNFWLESRRTVLIYRAVTAHCRCS
jgi:hypothetical protein